MKGMEKKNEKIQRNPKGIYTGQGFTRNQASATGLKDQYDVYDSKYLAGKTWKATNL